MADPDNPKALNQEAQLLAQKSEYDLALELYRKAMVLDPDFVVARSNFVQLLAKLGRFEEAIRYLRKQLVDDPEIQEGYSMLGLALDVSGRRKEAVETFRSGLEREPNNVKILRELAWIKATAKTSNGEMELRRKNWLSELWPWPQMTRFSASTGSCLYQKTFDLIRLWELPEVHYSWLQPMATKVFLV